MELIGLHPSGPRLPGTCRHISSAYPGSDVKRASKSRAQRITSGRNTFSPSTSDVYTSCISEILYGLLVCATNRRRRTDSSLDVRALDVAARGVASVVPTATLTTPPEDDADSNAASQSAFDSFSPLSIPSSRVDVG